MADPTDKNDAKFATALARYRLIAEAVEIDDDDLRQGILKELAAKEHQRPDGSSFTVSLRTLKRWVQRFQHGQLQGLQRTPRRDRGRLRSLTEATLERAIALRKEAPSRSTTTLIDILERDQQIAAGAVRRSTLDRHLEHRDASRRRLHVLGQKRHVRLSFEHPLDFVLGDFHFGPYVRAPDGQIQRALLCAFIDHCSRFVPESRYGLTQDVMALRRGLRALVTAVGLPRKFYVDNGSAYQSERFHFGCAQLGIQICHSRPYVSEGRGGIERFNRNAKESFEVEVRLRKEPPTLEELNDFWFAWLEERYHRRVHSEIGETPRDRWERLRETADIRRVDPVLADEVLRLHARRKVHPKTSTVEMGGVRFVVDTALRGRRVDVLYDPHDLSSVLVYFDGRRIQRATAQQPGEHPLPAPALEPVPPASVDYLGLVRRDYEARRAEELSHLRFTRVDNEGKRLTLPLLIERLQVCCGRTLGQVERQHAASVLETLAPVEVPIVDAALKRAVATLGHGLHASSYLDAVREHILGARRKGTS